MENSRYTQTCVKQKAISSPEKYCKISVIEPPQSGMDMWASYELLEEGFKTLFISKTSLTNLCEESTCLVARNDDEEVIGFIAASGSINKQYIWYLTTDVCCRNKGIGTALLQKLIDTGDTLQLNVRELNTTAINLYKSLGFNVVAKHPGYYPNGDTAYVMEYSEG